MLPVRHQRVNLTVLFPNSVQHFDSVGLVGVTCEHQLRCKRQKSRGACDEHERDGRKGDDFFHDDPPQRTRRIVVDSRCKKWPEWCRFRDFELRLGRERPKTSGRRRRVPSVEPVAGGGVEASGFIALLSTARSAASWSFMRRHTFLRLVPVAPKSALLRSPEEDTR